MKKMKRLVALLVCLATVASLCVFSIPVSAEDVILNEDGLPIIEVSEADLLLIEKLEAMGAITNEYDPVTYVTRRQMTEIITKYLKLSVGNSSAETPFRDVTVKDPSFPTIKTLYDMGIVTGDEQLQFHPDRNLTYDEALVFIINAIGHKSFAVRQGGFPTGYHRVAINHGMLKNLSMNKGSDPVTLVDLYKMLDAAMSAAVVEASYNGDGTISYTLSKTATFLSDVYDIKEYRGKVTGNEYTKLGAAKGLPNDEYIEIDGTVYDVPGYYYGYFLGYTVDYYIDHASPEPKLIYIEEAPKMNELITLDVEDILEHKTTSDRIYYEDEEKKEHHISFVAAPKVIYNQQYWGGWSVLADVIPATGYIKALDNNDDGTYDIIFVYEYTNHVVASVDSYNKMVTDKLGASIDLHQKRHKVMLQFVDENNTKAEFSSIMPNDVLSIVRSKSAEKVITVFISRNVLSGRIAEEDPDLGFSIEGEYYKQAPGYFGSTVLSAGVSGDFYLDMYNEIVTYKYSDAAEESVYGVVAGLDFKPGVLNYNITLKIFTQDGTFIEQPLAKKVWINNYMYDISKNDVFNSVLSMLSLNSPGNILDINYVIKYVSNGVEITKIDTGAIGGPGTLNPVDVLGTGTVTVRSRYLLIYKNSAGNRVFGKYESTNGLIFKTPKQGEIDREQDYEVTKTMTIERDYSNFESFAFYSANKTDIPLVDVMLFRGMGASSISAKESGIAVITDVTTAVDQNGSPTRKLYFDNSRSVLVAPLIKFRDGTGTSAYTENVEITSLVTGSGATLKPGVAIQYSTDSDGVVDTISTVAKYESGTFSPLFYHTLSYWNNEGELGYTQNRGLVAGEILLNDTETQLVEVRLGGSSPNDRILYTGAIDSAVMYIASEKKAVSVDVADLKPDDMFIIRVKNYFDVADIIIFRP